MSALISCLFGVTPGQSLFPAATALLGDTLEWKDLIGYAQDASGNCGANAAMTINVKHPCREAQSISRSLCVVGAKTQSHEPASLEDRPQPDLP